MNWISNIVRPKIKDLFSKRDTPENLWVKCPETQEMIFAKDLEANQYVVPSSGYHFKIPAKERLTHFFDKGEFKSITFDEVAQDPLHFKDTKKYEERIKSYRKKLSSYDAMILGYGKIDGTPITAAVQDFAFMGGSLGMAAGEAFITGARHAIEQKSPYVLFVSSGGARMQEGILSLMQMPRTTIAIQELKENKLPYIVVLTNPTTGGVTASYAMLGDIHLAEPGALIGFAGPRVIESTIREKLPDGFQKSEYLLEHGMIDQVVNRKDLKKTIGVIVRMLMDVPEPRLAITTNQELDIPKPAVDDASSKTTTKDKDLDLNLDKNVDVNIDKDDLTEKAKS